MTEMAGTKHRQPASAGGPFGPGPACKRGTTSHRPAPDLTSPPPAAAAHPPPSSSAD
jgi:hypothetical protein